MLYKIAPALDTAVYRYAESEEEVRWLTAAKKMAFGVACRAILGDKFTEEDHEYMFPLYSTISNGLVSLVRFRFYLSGPTWYWVGCRRCGLPTSYMFNFQRMLLLR